MKRIEKENYMKELTKIKSKNIVFGNYDYELETNTHRMVYIEHNKEKQFIVHMIKRNETEITLDSKTFDNYFFEMLTDAIMEGGK